MKILYFHQHFNTPEGSGGTRSYEMSRRLIARGHTVTIVCGSYGGGKTGLTQPFQRGVRRGMVEGIDVIEFELPYSNAMGFVQRSMVFLKYALRSISVAMWEKYDLLFATSTPLTAGIPGICAALLRRKPFVFEVRDLWPEIPRAMGIVKNPIIYGMMSLLEWMSYHTARRCIGLAPGIVDGIVRRGIPKDRVVLVPNGSDLDIFSSGTDGGAWRPEGVDPNDLMAVYPGTHGLANGLDALLKVAEVLQKRGTTSIKLVFVGDGKMKPALVADAKQRGLNNVIFLDPISKRRLAGLLASDVVGMQVFANVKEFYWGTSPNKFFDYLAAGVPVVTNYPGWVATLIGENDCGIAVPADQPEAFADALEKLAASQAERRRMGENARSLANREFHRDILADRFANWLEGSVA